MVLHEDVNVVTVISTFHPVRFTNLKELNAVILWNIPLPQVEILTRAVEFVWILPVPVRSVTIGNIKETTLLERSLCDDEQLPRLVRLCLIHLKAISSLDRSELVVKDLQ